MGKKSKKSKQTTRNDKVNVQHKSESLREISENESVSELPVPQTDVVNEAAAQDPKGEEEYSGRKGIPQSDDVEARGSEDGVSEARGIDDSVSETVKQTKDCKFDSRNAASGMQSQNTGRVSFNNDRRDRNRNSSQSTGDGKRFGHDGNPKRDGAYGEGSNSRREENDGNRPRRNDDHKGYSGRRHFPSESREGENVEQRYHRRNDTYENNDRKDSADRGNFQARSDHYRGGNDRRDSETGRNTFRNDRTFYNSNRPRNKYNSDKRSESSSWKYGDNKSAAESRDEDKSALEPKEWKVTKGESAPDDWENGVTSGDCDIHAAVPQENSDTGENAAPSENWNTDAVVPQEKWDTEGTADINTARDEGEAVNVTDYLEGRRDSIPEEYRKFEVEFLGGPEITFVKVKERESDLFDMPEEYALAHCVAADFRMGSGIALKFRRRFGYVEKLRNQNQAEGGLAVLTPNQRYIYYLVTKRFSDGKPTLVTLWKSLQKMKQDIIENDVKKLAVPRIGCGLDCLRWPDVKRMLEYTFQDVDVELIVCNWQPPTDGEEQGSVNDAPDLARHELEGSIDMKEPLWDGCSTTDNMEPNESKNFAKNSSTASSNDGKTGRSKKDDVSSTASSNDGKSWRSRKDDHFRKRSSSRQRRDAEFEIFERTIMHDKSKIDFQKVKEMDGDVFAMPEDYAIGHCVAEDMNMGSGIAVQFRQKFKKVDELLDQRQRQGGLAVLQIGKRYVYYLVTKRTSSGKPTYLTFWNSLQKMKKHIADNGVKKLTLPRIGCGLDGLEWICVKKMLEHIFQDVDVEITICNFQQTDEPSSAAPARKKTKIVNYPRPIVELEDGSIIIYLGSEDGHVTDEIRSLGEKFRMEDSYRKATRKVGETVRTIQPRQNYILHGFIVRKKKDDPFSYTNFQKCLSAVQKQNRKDGFYYVGLQAFEDKSDVLVMSKVVNLMRNSLTQVDIYICWPPELQERMPKVSAAPA